MPAPRRAEILYRAAQIFTERKAAYSRDMTREMGKVLKETEGDVQEAIDMSQLMAGEGRRMYGQTVPSELRNKFAMSVRQPIGVCGIITAWNFPIAVPSWKILPALVCGNTVVFKPSEEAPLSAINFVQALADAGVPPGVVNLVTGDGPGAAAPMLTDPDVRVMSFTGSTKTGRLINEQCAATFKKVHLEMGGKNVILVMDDANLDLAIDGCVWGGFGTTGQRCTAASRVVVHKKVYAEFLERFAARAQALRVGDGLDPSIEMGPSISETQLTKVMEYVEIGKAEGARLRTGGNRLTSGVHAKGYFHEPTIFADVAPGMRIAREEIFGPVVSVIPCGSFDEAVRIANDVDYGAVGVNLHAGHRQGVQRDARRSAPGCSTSTLRRSAPKSTCRSAAPKPPATATGKRVSRRSTSSRMEVDLRRLQRQTAARADGPGADHRLNRVTGRECATLAHSPSITSGVNVVVSPKIDEVVWDRILRLQLLQVRQRRLDRRHFHALEERRRALAIVVRARVEIDQAIDDIGDPARRHLGREAAELRALIVDAAADHHEILRHHAIAQLADAALEADARDVMLAAAVRAAAHLDLQVRRLRRHLGMRAKVRFERLAEPARLRHRETARFGARAARHILDRARAREAQARRREVTIELRNVARLHPAEHEVLIHRHAERAVAVRLRAARRARAAARPSGRRAAPSP